MLARVTDVKETPFYTFVGGDTGFDHLARISMYGAYYAIVNATRVHGRKAVVCIVGNLCESGDVFAGDRSASACQEGDLLAISVAGAYGFCMSTNHNSRPRPAEVLVKAGQARVIRDREEIA